MTATGHRWPAQTKIPRRLENETSAQHWCQKTKSQASSVHSLENDPSCLEGPSTGGKGVTPSAFPYCPDHRHHHRPTRNACQLNQSTRKISHFISRTMNKSGRNLRPREQKQHKLRPPLMPPVYTPQNRRDLTTGTASRYKAVNLTKR